MKNSYYQKVLEFRTKFELDSAIADYPTFWDEVRKKLEHLSEENNELNESLFDTENRHDAADAIGDLIYLLCGLAAVLKVPLDEVFDRIHEANMKKERVLSESESKRNDPFDLKKPNGWSAPSFDDLFEKDFPFEESMKLV